MLYDPFKQFSIFNICKTDILNGGAWQLTMQLNLPPHGMKPICSIFALVETCLKMWLYLSV